MCSIEDRLAYIMRIDEEIKEEEAMKAQIAKIGQEKQEKINKQTRRINDQVATRQFAEVREERERERNRVNTEINRIGEDGRRTIIRNSVEYNQSWTELDEARRERRQERQREEETRRYELQQLDEMRRNRDFRSTFGFNVSSSAVTGIGLFNV